jgi:[NiFe] hydrogenase assembly HybE family chaperone
VPGAQGEWPNAAEGERIVRQLPAGDCGFYGCFEPVIGEFHASSVCSPMSRFADQAAARAEAQRSLDAWLAVPEPAEPDAGAADGERRAFLRRMIPGDRWASLKNTHKNFGTQMNADDKSDKRR